MRLEFLRFLLVGASNTLLSWLLFVAFVRFMPYAAAYTLAYGLSIISSYFFNVRFVFKVRVSLASFLKFPLVYIVQYSLGMLLMWLIAGYMKVQAELAMATAMAISIPVTFIVSGKIVKPRAEI